MSIESIKKLINFQQPKYKLPAILYIPFLITGYFGIGIFTTETAEVPNNSLQTTDYLNPNMPDSYIKGDGIGSKYDNMRNSYGSITDESAVNIIDRNNEEQKEDFESQYSEDELASLEAQRQDGQAGQTEQSKAGVGTVAQNAREQEALQELERVLAEARLKGQMQSSLSEDNSEQ